MSDLVPHSLSNVEQLMELLADQRRVELELAPSSHGSRLAKRQTWAVARRFTEQERERLLALVDTIGLTPIPDEPRDLEADEITAMMAEVLKVREVEDIVKGRYDAFRTSVFNAMNVRMAEVSAEPELESAVICAPEFGKKFSREVKGGKPVPDWNKLADLVPEDVWRKIALRVVTEETVYNGDGEVVGTESTTSWRIDEAATLQAIRDEEVTLEHLAAITSYSKKVPSLYIRDMGPGDE